MCFQKPVLLALLLTAAAGALAAAVSTADPPAARPGATEAAPRRTAPATPPAEPPQPARGRSHLLAFRAGGYVLTDPEGKNAKRLGETPKEFAPSGARLSPDGKRLATTMHRALPQPPEPSEAGAPPPSGLYVRSLDENADGSEVGVVCRTFAWSPDGSEIACSNYADGPGGPAKVSHFLVGVNAGRFGQSTSVKVLKLPEGHILSDWSSDGRFFLTRRFVAEKDGPVGSRLYLVARDGAGQKALTDDSQLSSFGRLSPDSKRVLAVLVTPRKEGAGKPKRELAVINAATGQTAAVGGVPSNGVVISFCWSPDGGRIAYSWREAGDDKAGRPAEEEVRSHLVVCDADGGNRKTIASERGGNARSATVRDLDWR